MQVWLTCLQTSADSALITSPLDIPLLMTTTSATPSSIFAGEQKSRSVARCEALTTFKLTISVSTVSQSEGGGRSIDGSVELRRSWEVVGRRSKEVVERPRRGFRLTLSVMVVSRGSARRVGEWALSRTVPLSGGVSTLPQHPRIESLRLAHFSSRFNRCNNFFFNLLLGFRLSSAVARACELSSS